MSAHLTEARALYESGKLREVYEALKGLGEECFSEPEVLWWYARACYDWGVEVEDKEERKRIFEDGMEKAAKCREVAPELAEGWKWNAILLGKMGDLISTSDKIKSAFIIREYADKAVELNPTDSTSQHVLGAWHFNVSNVSWTTRTLAKTFFAEPPSSTFETALPYLQKAYELNPNNSTNNLLLGECHQMLKDPASAKKFYQLVVDIDPTTNKLKEQKAKAEQALKKL